MIEAAPLKFKPYFKSVIWGGNKICAYKGIDQKEPNIGESWEISALPGLESVVAEGIYKGKNLTDLIKDYGVELLGKKVVAKYGMNFPLLIKIIDANDNLSVQVHPDDNLAKKRHGSLGKTEMWYIIEAEKDAKIYAGLKDEMTPQEYVNRVKDGSFADSLAEHGSKAGDIFFLPAGRVHAIGAGNLLAEIQETSDITYRIYDYDRRDANGNPRELHTELAKDAIDFKVYPEYKSKVPGKEDKIAKIASCEHFVTERILLDKELNLQLAPDSFNILICIEGSAVIRYGEKEMSLKQGESVLLPAMMTDVCLNGKSVLLKTSL